MYSNYEYVLNDRKKDCKKLQWGKLGNVCRKILIVTYSINEFIDRNVFKVIEHLCLQIVYPTVKYKKA